MAFSVELVVGATVGLGQFRCQAVVVAVVFINQVSYIKICVISY